jgi:hypothetical protein
LDVLGRLLIDAAAEVVRLDSVDARGYLGDVRDNAVPGATFADSEGIDDLAGRPQLRDDFPDFPLLVGPEEAVRDLRRVE